MLTRGMAEERIQVGGQAVIEGVMMRSKDSYAVAVRRRDGSIYVRRRPYRSLVPMNSPTRRSFLSKPPNGLA